MHGALLGIHIAAGSLGLLLGPLAMTAPKRPGRHTRAGLAYQAATAFLAITAIGLAVYNWSELWFLALIAIGTEAAALGGWLVQERRRPGWLTVHISLMCGSYISFVTALLVANSNSIVAWILPTIVGSPLIAWAAVRVTTGRTAAAR